MKTAKILKIEDDGQCMSATIAIPSGSKLREFDLLQLGGFEGEYEEPRIDNTTDVSDTIFQIDGSGFKLKAGDSISDEAGGWPVRGEIRKDNDAMRDVRDQEAVRANDEWKADYANKHKDRR